jgi:hypothetical protein
MHNQSRHSAAHYTSVNTMQYGGHEPHKTVTQWTRIKNNINHVYNEAEETGLVWRLVKIAQVVSLLHLFDIS